MSYIIQYLYETGNTFNTSSGNTGRFEYVFNSLDLAKAALARMKEHYNWSTGQDSAYKRDKIPRPSWLKADPEVLTQGFSDKEAVRFRFNVQGNDQEIWLHAGDYIGYFETLESAQIVRPTQFDDDMRFTI